MEKSKKLKGLAKDPLVRGLYRLVVLIFITVGVFGYGAKFGFDYAQPDEAIVKTFIKNTVTITWVFNEEDVQNALAEQKTSDGIPAVGKAFYNFYEDECTIWVLEPENPENHTYVQGHVGMEILGHEMLHCFRGGFHD